MNAGDGGIEQNRIGLHHAFFNIEVRDAAVESDRLVPRNFQLQHFQQMKTDGFHHQLADFTAIHQHRHVTAGATEHGRY